MSKRRKSNHNIQDVEFVRCPYCENNDKNKYKVLHWIHLRNIHGKALDDVRNEFPDIPTITLTEYNKKINCAKLGGKKISETKNELKESKCWHCDNVKSVPKTHSNNFLCDDCMNKGLEDKDGRTKEEAKMNRTNTFQKRYGEKIKNARDLPDTNDKIEKTSNELYGGIGRASKKLNEKYEEGMLRNHGKINPMLSEKLKNKNLECKQCGEIKRVAINYENDLCPDCRDERFPGMLEVDDNGVVCQICWRGVGRIFPEHIKTHNISLEEYKNKFPDGPIFSKSYLEKSSEGGKIGGKIGKPTGYKIMNCIYCGDLFTARRCSDTYTRCPICKKEGIPSRGYKGSKEAREKQRARLLNGASLEMNKRNNIISNPQKALFDIIKGYYPDAILNDPFKEINRIADISIPSLNIIIESDGSYFHKDKDDNYRDILFNDIGWRVIRFRNIDSVNNLPFEEDIIEYIDSFNESADDVLIIE